MTKIKYSYKLKLFFPAGEQPEVCKHTRHHLKENWATALGLTASKKHAPAQKLRRITIKQLPAKKISFWHHSAVCLEVSWLYLCSDVGNYLLLFSLVIFFVYLLPNVFGHHGRVQTWAIKNMKAGCRSRSVHQQQEEHTAIKIRKQRI